MAMPKAMSVHLGGCGWRLGRRSVVLAVRTTSSFGKYTHAFVREISPSLSEEALRLNNDEANVNIQVAIEQHERLISCMEKMVGLKIIKLSHENLADSVFVEDTCVIVGNKVLITNPGAISRRSETKLVHRKISEMNYFKSITNMSLESSVAHLDGGDVSKSYFRHLPTYLLTYLLYYLLTLRYYLLALKYTLELIMVELI